MQISVQHSSVFSVGTCTENRQHTSVFSVCGSLCIFVVVSFGFNIVTPTIMKRKSSNFPSKDVTVYLVCRKWSSQCIIMKIVYLIHQRSGFFMILQVILSCIEFFTASSWHGILMNITNGKHNSWFVFFFRPFFPDYPTRHTAQNSLQTKCLERDQNKH